MSRTLRGAIAALAVLVALGLTSCASLADQLRDQLDSSVSASASASLALTLLDDGKALAPFTDTTLGDALKELDSASEALTQTGALTHGSNAREEALDAVRSATDAVLAGRDAAASGEDLGPSIAAVDLATERLRSLSDELPQ
jgi:hypothetical protein